MTKDFPEEWRKNRTDEELEALKKVCIHSYTKFYELDSNVEFDFTCDECLDRNICILAYDMYNLDGDCLLAK